MRHANKRLLCGTAVLLALAWAAAGCAVQKRKLETVRERHMAATLALSRNEIDEERRIIQVAKRDTLTVKDESGKLVWQCPKCGNRDEAKLNVARRTCGYIGSQFWNQGRTQEIKERVLHVS